MTSPFRAGVGAILSADIAVPEHEREVRFYSRVLTTGEDPLWREDLMNAQGTPIIGLGARGPEYETLPLQWMPHIQVADVGASVRRALELGGAELMHGRGEDGLSQWAVLQDPNGAAFGIIPVVSEDELPKAGAGEAGPSGRVGHIRWVDLTVPNAPATRDFYRQVIGWTVQDVQMTDADQQYADYSMCGDDNYPTAGICHARGGNAGLPRTWLLYLPVGDFAESLRRVEAEGGTIIKSTAGTGDEYTYAIVQDPVGAYFAVAPAERAPPQSP